MQTAWKPIENNGPAIAAMLHCGGARRANNSVAEGRSMRPGKDATENTALSSRMDHNKPGRFASALATNAARLASRLIHDRTLESHLFSNGSHFYIWT